MAHGAGEMQGLKEERNCSPTERITEAPAGEHRLTILEVGKKVIVEFQAELVQTWQEFEWRDITVTKYKKPDQMPRDRIFWRVGGEYI